MDNDGGIAAMLVLAGGTVTWTTKEDSTKSEQLFFLPQMKLGKKLYNFLMK